MELPLQNNADAIDSHDVVIRMNRGMPKRHNHVGKPFHDVTNKVGTKTTVLAGGKFTPLSVVFAHQMPDQLWWFKQETSSTGERDLEEMQCYRPLGGKPWWRWPMAWEKEVLDALGCQGSTGIRLAWMMDHKAKPKAVSLFGFTFWGCVNGGSKLNWHSQMPAAEAHNAAAEYRYFLDQFRYDHLGEGRWTRR